MASRAFALSHFEPRLARPMYIRAMTTGGITDPAMRLAVSVIERFGAGEGVEVQLTEPVGVEVRLQDCHDNVERFLAVYRDHQGIFGFLVAHRAWRRDVLVVAHRVARAPDGVLHDITPRVSYDVPFLFVEHKGTLDEFKLIAIVEPYQIGVPDALVAHC